MNALLYIAEHISASHSSQLDQKLFEQHLCLVLHCSCRHRVPPCNMLGKAFSPLPVSLPQDDAGGVPVCGGRAHFL